MPSSATGFVRHARARSSGKSRSTGRPDNETDIQESHEVTMDANVLDVAALERQTGGDAGLRGELVQMFLEDCPQRVEAIGAAIGLADPAALASASHALKGSAAYLKAAAVRDCAADLERCGRDGRLPDAPAAFDRLRAAVDDLLPELRKLILPRT